MVQKSGFNSLSRALIDAWIVAPTPLEDAAELYRDLVAGMGIKMSLNYFATSEADPLDWRYSPLKSYGVRSKLADIAALVPPGRLADMPDRAYVLEKVIPSLSRSLAVQSPLIDVVETRILGFNVGYDRVVLPQKTARRPSWCLTFTEGRFLLAPPSEQAPIDPADESILQLRIEGLTAREAADVLAMSPRTVEHRIEKLKTRFDARNVVHLTAMFLSTHMGRRIADERIRLAETG